jgi:hypothetical protein
MAWKIFNGPFAMTTRRRIITSSLIYGLSLTIRLTSSAGEEAAHPAQAAQNISAPRSFMISDSIRTFNDRSLISAQPIAFDRDWLLVSRGCRAECERPIQLASLPDCCAP